MAPGGAIFLFSGQTNRRYLPCVVEHLLSAIYIQKAPYLSLPESKSQFNLPQASTRQGINRLGSTIYIGANEHFEPTYSLVLCR